MRIKFKSPDPRAGTVAQMDSHRGAQLVAAGAADQIGEDGKPVAKARQQKAPAVDRAALDAALAELPGDHTDPDYVVRGMRSHFLDLFTEDDERTVRELVMAPVPKPSEGLNVEQLKTALQAKQIEIPAGTTLKADLARLLDEAS